MGKKEAEEKDERRARKREKGRSLNTREGGSKMKKGRRIRETEEERRVER